MATSLKSYTLPLISLTAAAVALVFFLLELLGRGKMDAAALGVVIIFAAAGVLGLSSGRRGRRAEPK